MIETPQWLSFTVTIMSVSFIMAYEDLSLQCQLLLFPHLLHSCGSGHILFIEQKNFVPLPQSLAPATPMLPSFYQFHHFIVSITFTLAQVSLPQHLLHLKLPPFSTPLFYFTYQHVKWSYLLVHLLLFFLTICKFRESLFILRTSICLLSLTVSGMQ